MLWPYKGSGYESFASKSRGNWKQLGNQCLGVGHLLDEKTESIEVGELVRACSFVIVGGRALP